MIIYNKMFAEKILAHVEHTNRFLLMLYKVPGIGENLYQKIVFEDNRKLKENLGRAAEVFLILLEFLRKYIYVLLFMYVPYRIIGHFCPLVASHQETTMVYLFFMLSSLCGSIANTTIMAMGDRDYLMIRVFLISPYMNFFGKLIYKVVTDFVYFTLILSMFGVTFWRALCLSILTAACRPVGEMIAILIFEESKKIYDNRGTFNGMVMAVCVLLAYGLPVFTRKVGAGWLWAASPLAALIMIIAGAAATAYLWWYKHYRKIVREAMYLRRE